MLKFKVLYFYPSWVTKLFENGNVRQILRHTASVLNWDTDLKKSKNYKSFSW